MSVRGSCHCGKVKLEVPTEPEWVGSCNCSLCRKLSWLVAYYPPHQVVVTGETRAYVWGDRMIGIHHCPNCGCGTHWASLGEDFGKMGVNARLLDGFCAEKVEVRFLDNADT
ncbi:MAG TPA: GFA family protein [Sphingomicrobium sp.]|nr:GFA family protein [Sphingomicrobium sp.]